MSENASEPSSPMSENVSAKGVIAFEPKEMPLAAAECLPCETHPTAE